MAAPPTTEQLKEAFYLFDNDKDGEAPWQDLQIGMNALGFTPTPDQISACFKQAKVDPNKPMKQMDFIHLMQEVVKLPSDEPALLEAFKVFDREHTGFVNIADLRKVMESIPDRLEDAQIDAMMKEADDGTGKIEYANFVKVMIGQPK
ncbi:putative VU91B calmodulin [Monocercomonoides exilis]|uniref:putative VU91B calmodulin n=1 Tax=Monocercomonoides exilis TaxID=2049356 RepID=UPI00355A83ED|nr:putative VU91B calmodulin [Monocercomonoides exilis]|eukprot:MONOS_10558.1-p1 / transcript=MONOS_10558.1 / gene=MONOS_10558 / organism=Monocercomonoides_exilis_PA203 / gene_product=VU91B calmodulin / transcript_product=VU91B calmodulin / location=Mono_scaffold00485:11434-12109(-) / protein_length=147 / sequence_SO=supercontig / SO=protein_coding / is_pseudo=false